jgi:hypothetical protein
MTVSAFDARDARALLLVLLLPVLVALPEIAGWLDSDPLLYSAAISSAAQPGILHGYPTIDPNAGFQTQALGYRAMRDWLEGTVPWWNPYSGIGLPLAGEYQPAAFFPLTLVLLLPHGMLWERVLLQVLAGWGTYFLLRRLAIGRAASCIGAILFAFNGTFAWLSHGPSQAAAFLPWMLLGIERARAFTLARHAGGWRLFTLAMAGGLLAGFPETTYICGLLALVWWIVRAVQLPRERIPAFAGRVALGGIAGVLVSAPQVLAFFEYLPQAYIGIHSEVLAHSRLNPLSWIPSLVAPYAWGPIFAYSDRWPELAGHWGGIGGYVTLALVVCAVFGLAVRGGALAWTLAAWVALSLAKSADIAPATALLNLVPGVAETAFARYSPPTWELALIVLAMRGLDAIAKRAGLRRGALALAGAAAAAGIVAGLHEVGDAWPRIHAFVPMRNWATGSLAWAAITAIACIALLARRGPRAARLAGAILAIDAIVMFAIPTFSAQRGATLDLAAVRYLQEHIGLQRFFTLGPLQPNYGAYLGIASINHNYLPVAQRWVDWLHAHLDRDAEPVVFNGNYPRAPGQRDAAEELRRNIADYRAAGVKFVLVPPGADPFGAPGDPAREGVRLAYESAAMRIFELSSPSPYFDPVKGNCAVSASTRTLARLDCAGPGTLVRRELYFPGWRAEVNGREMPIWPYESVFQAIDLPTGSSEVRFRYAPPHIEWAWAAFALGCLLLVVPRRSRLSAPA